MSQLYYVAMRADASLLVVSVAEAIPFHKDDLFGPYRSYNDAEAAAQDAEGWFWIIALPYL